MLGHIRSVNTAMALATTLSLSSLFCASTLASNGFSQPGPASTLGKVSSGQTRISNSANPAAIGFDRRAMGEQNTLLGGVYIGGGVEYGHIQELFDTYDELATAFNDAEQAGTGSGLDFGVIDLDNPDIADIISRVETQARRIGTLLRVVASEGYANADAAIDIPLIFKPDAFGGTVGLNLSYNGSISAASFVEAINFDAATAQTELQAAFNLQAGDPKTTYDLSGGISLTIDPNTSSVSGTFDNDSLLATRAAEDTQLGVSYSYPIAINEYSTVYLGSTVKYVRMGLARVATRIGDITDTEDLIDDIRDAKFINTNRLSMDLGALWVDKNMTLGASVTDAFEPSYKFNAIDTSNYSNPELASLIDKLQTYKQKRQITLEASTYTEDRAWALSTSYETNAIKDPLGVEHQWLSISGGWHSKSPWIPSVRLGYQVNQVGSKIDLYKLGFTLFNYVDLDFAMSSDKVTIDGDSLPRAGSVSLGFHYLF